MIYRVIKRPLLALVKAPKDPPDAPAGSHDSVEVYRASPRFLTYRLLWFWIVALTLLVAAFLFIVVALASGEPQVAAVVAPIALLVSFVLFLVYFGIRVDYDLRYYVVTDRSLRVREGAWIVREKTISYANVQNLRVQQGPVQRAFNISNLKVETAGGGAAAQGEGKLASNAHEVAMRGIDNAPEVRDAILGHLKKFGHGSGLGDLDDERASLASPEVRALLGDIRDAAAALRASASPGGLADG